MRQSVGLFLFPDVEVLDFAGPFEVFAVASQLHDHALFDVATIAKTRDPVRAINGLSVNPDAAFNDHPPIDIAIIPGGSGTRALLSDDQTLAWVAKQVDAAKTVVSVCSGARLLGALGRLDDQEFCTHQEVYAHMAEIAPKARPRPDLRFVRAGKLYTSGGISAGIDVSLHVVAALCGEPVAERTATYMEYQRRAAA